MVTLALPKLGFDEEQVNPVLRVAEYVAEQLSRRFTEVTTSIVGPGTRIYRLLNLDQSYDNLVLLNAYQSSRREIAQAIDEIISEVNEGNPHIRLRIAPRGYRVNDVDVASLAYVVTLLAYSPDDLTGPTGLIFIQAYSTSRSEASSLKRDDSLSGEEEYEVDE